MISAVSNTTNNLYKKQKYQYSKNKPYTKLPGYQYTSRELYTPLAVGALVFQQVALFLRLYNHMYHTALYSFVFYLILLTCTSIPCLLYSPWPYALKSFLLWSLGSNIILLYFCFSPLALDATTIIPDILTISYYDSGGDVFST